MSIKKKTRSKMLTYAQFIVGILETCTSTKDYEDEYGYTQEQHLRQYCEVLFRIAEVELNVYS